MTFDIDQAISERFQKTGGSAMVPAGNKGENSTIRGVYANPDDPPWWSNVGKGKWDPETLYRRYGNRGESIDMRQEFPFRSEQWDALMKVLELPPEIREAINERYHEKEKYLEDMFRKQAFEMGDDYDTFNIMAENKAKDDALHEFGRELESAKDKYQAQSTKDAKAKLARRRANEQAKKDRIQEKKMKKRPPEGDDGEIQWRPLTEEEKAEFDDSNDFDDGSPFGDGTQSFKDSCDINSRMSQWSAAGRAQHTGETEAILKTGDSFFEERGQGGEPVARYDLYNLRGPKNWEYLRNTELWPGDKYFIDRLKLAQKTKGDSVLGSLAMLPWVHPMMSQEATEAREADLQGKKSETEKEEGEGESEKKTENGEKTESFKDSFNIDARMKQWDAANKAQHNGETERILKTGGSSFVPDEDSTGFWDDTLEPGYINPDDPEEKLDQFGLIIYDGDEKLGVPNKERVGKMIWEAPINSEEAAEARGVAPAGSLGAAIENQNANEAFNKLAKKTAGVSKINLDGALRRAGLSREARDLAAWYINNGYDFDKAVKMAQTQQTNPQQ